MIIYCDGGSRGNPGFAASAFVVVEKDKVIFKEGKYLGIETNNVAEYVAVLNAVRWLVKNNNGSDVIINLDSQLVERQLNGFYKVKSEKLKSLYNEILEIIASSKLKIKFQWGYRSKNSIADELVNETLDLNKNNN